MTDITTVGRKKKEKWNTKIGLKESSSWGAKLT